MLVVRKNPKQILELNWGIKAKRIVRYKDALKVYTGEKLMCLKKTNYKPDRMNFLMAAILKIIENGFKNIPVIFPCLNGEYFCTHDGHSYYLTDWIDGRECDFRKMPELEKGAKALAELHLSAKGYVSTKKSRIRKKWGKHVRIFRENYEEMKNIKTMLESQIINTAYDKKVLKTMDFFLPLAQRAIDLLENSSYHKLAEEAMIEGVIIHGDVAARNFLITKEKEVHIIDFDTCQLDIRIVDVYKLIRRTLKKAHWSPQVAYLALDAYNSVYPLRPEEYPLLLAFLMFPQKYWRNLNRYYSEKHRWPERTFMRKLNKFLMQKEGIRDFLACFEPYCLKMAKGGS